jgi:hypothetical protein
MTDDRPQAWKLLVLSYVDGELDAAKRREVEAWIAADSEVAELARELRETGRGGAFRDAEPPLPRPDDLTRSGEQILARLRPVRRQNLLRPAILSAAVAAMAALLYFACPPEHACEIATAPAVPAPTPADPLAEYDDLPIASSGEARVSSIRGDVAPVFVACEDLLPDLLEFASAEEMQIHKTGRSALSMPGPDDAPMIFQIQTRAK